MAGLTEIEKDGYLPVLVTTAQPEHKLRALVVMGSNPGQVREIVSNPLPYPRQERSPDFAAMVDRLHAVLTDTLLPEAKPAAAAAAQRLVPFPRVHVVEVTGLLDHLLAQPEGRAHLHRVSQLQSRDSIS